MDAFAVQIDIELRLRACVCVRAYVGRVACGWKKFNCISGDYSIYYLFGVCARVYTPVPSAAIAINSTHTERAYKHTQTQTHTFALTRTHNFAIKLPAMASFVPALMPPV